MFAVRVTSPNPRVVDVVRPLAVGAARYTDQFDCLAPAHLNVAGVLSQLFKLYEMEACGWCWRTTGIDDLGGYDGYRKWRVSK